jgi:hypothetical protein
VILLTISTTTISQPLAPTFPSTFCSKKCVQSSSFCSTKKLHPEKFLFIDLLENIVADHRKPALSERLLGFEV